MEQSRKIPTNVLHINTHDKAGGAASVAWRLAGNQRTSGIESKLLVGYKKTRLSISDDFEIEPDPKLMRLCRDKGHLFYEFQGSHALLQHPWVKSADIIHLHNLHGDYFNPWSLLFLSNFRPIVWTLHDMHALTGHCAHSFDCNAWQHGCGGCPYPETEPALQRDTSDLLLSHKQLIFGHSPLWVVTPSEWLKNKVEKSVLQSHPVYVVHNGVDVRCFRPMDKKRARAVLGLPQNKILVGSVANGGSLSNPWKGGEYTQAAIEFLQFQSEDILFVDIGGSGRSDDPRILSIPHISGQSKLAIAYNALDLFIYTPRADNCPLVVLEAMACGLPVVSFNRGGIPEIVKDGHNGYVVEFQDILGLVQSVSRLVDDSSKRRQMGVRARSWVEERFNQAFVPEKYHQIYEKASEHFSLRKTTVKQLPLDQIPEVVKTPAFMNGYDRYSSQQKHEMVGKKVKAGLVQNDLPLISVVTPSFNQAPYLEDCIRSILDQDYPNIEYIVMDGGSKDGSRKIIEKYSHRLAYWQSEPDKGHYWAVQEGLRRCSGEIITWLNSDDKFYPHAFKIAAALFKQREEVDWITGRPNNINKEGTRYFETPTLPIWSRRRYLRKQFHHPYIQQEGTFWRRALWEKAGAMLDLQLELAADMELWARFFRHTKLYTVDFSFAAYRVHDDNRALVYQDKYLQEGNSVIEKELELIEDGRHTTVLPAPAPITKEQIQSYLKNGLPETSLSNNEVDFLDSEVNRSGSIRERATACVEEENTTRRIDSYKMKHDMLAEEKNLCGQYDIQDIILTAIVSTYNDEKFIKGCLEDLIRQTIFSQMEIIVIDSASEQDEASIVRVFQERHKNIKYIRTSSRENVYAAWNRGIRIAKGKYLTSANTDDRHRRDAFEIMVNVLEEKPDIALVYADVIKTQTENETFDSCTPIGLLKWYDWDRKKLLEKGCFIGPQPLWRRKVHDKYGYFNSDYTVSGDFEFWLRISQTYSFMHISTPLGLYLERSDSIEHRHQQKKALENQKILNHYRNGDTENQYIGINRNGRAIHDDNNNKNSTANKVSKAPADIDRQRDTHLQNRGGEAMHSPQVIIDAVDQLIESGQKEAARWILEKLVFDFPESAQGYYLRATIAFERNELEKALENFSKAVELEEDNPNYQKSLGDIYFVSNQDALRAMTHYQKVLSINPIDIDTLTTVAHLYVSMQQFDQARHYYQKVLEIDPNNHQIESYLTKLPGSGSGQPQEDVTAEALYTSAQNEIQNGNPDEAIGLLNRVVANDNTHAQAHNDLGVLYFEKGDKENAHHHYASACELQPENAVFQKNLADFLWFEKNDAQAAMEKYVQALKLDPQDIEALIGCAQVCMAIGKIEDSRDFLDCALEIEPWNSDVRQLVGRLDDNVTAEEIQFDNDACYLKAQQKAEKGDHWKAIEDLKLLLQHSPNHSIAYNDLGVLYYEAGDKEKARESYERAYEIAPEQPNIVKNLADFYLFEDKRVEDAMRLYLKVLEQTPEDIDCLMATAMVCTMMGKPEEAVVFYQRVLRLEPWHPEAKQALEKLEGGICSTDNGTQHAIG